MIKRFQHYIQFERKDCGPTCLQMIAKHYGKYYSLSTLRDKCFITREGVSMLGISDAAETIGLRSIGVKITLEQLIDDVPLPCILHWNQNHFVVCYKIKKRKNGKSQFYIADPGSRKFVCDEEAMKKCWISTRLPGSVN